jgi:hypothetical protein
MYSYNESLYQDHPAQITTAGHQATPSRPWSKHWIGSRATAPGPSHVPFATSRHGARPFFFVIRKKKNDVWLWIWRISSSKCGFHGTSIFSASTGELCFRSTPRMGNRLVRSDRLPGVHRLAPHRQHQGASAPKSEKETQQLCEILTLWGISKTWFA